MKWMKVAQLCLTLCDPKEYTVPGILHFNSILHGILQARILEWVAFPFSRGSSQPRDRTQVSCIAGRFFTSWATRRTAYWCEQKADESSLLLSSSPSKSTALILYPPRCHFLCPAFQRGQWSFRRCGKMWEGTWALRGRYTLKGADELGVCRVTMSAKKSFSYKQI